ncbi:MAG: hypothetical protein ACOCVR_03010, partial [Myxococcota bacterium]
MVVSNLHGLNRSLLALLAFLLMPFLVTACGGCDTEEEPELDEPEIVSFTVEPESIVRGEEEATLSWETQHALSIEIAVEGGEALDLGEVEAGEGSFAVSPEESTTYVLTATGEDGTEPVTASVSLTVVEPDPPAVVSFAAEPSEVLAGDEATLSWETTGGETLAISAGDTPLDLGEVSAEAGSHVVSPEETTTYTLTVTGPGGEDSAEATVTVRMAPTIVSFTATPDTPVIPGENEVTLAWETEDALAITLLAGEEVLLTSDNEEDFSSQHEVTVDLRTEYTLVVEGWLDSEATETLEVPVIPVIQTFEVDATLVRPDDEVLFSWTTLGADRVSLTGPGGLDHESLGEEALQGGHAFEITEEGIFTLVAESGNLDDTDTILIEVTNAPRINSLTASPDEITAGEQTVLAWETQGAETLSLTVSGIGEVDIGGQDLGSDQVSVTLTEAGTATATLTAENADGDAVSEADIEVLAVPVIDSFSALPLRVGTGESTELTWETTDAETVRVEKNGSDIGLDAALTTGSASDTVDEESSYVLYAANALGYEVASDPVVVSIASPEIVSFEASSGQVAPETDFDLSWECSGGNSLTVSLDGTAVCESTVEADIASGGCTLTAPQEGGSYTYEIEVANGEGSDTAQVDV